MLTTGENSVRICGMRWWFNVVLADSVGDDVFLFYHDVNRILPEMNMPATDMDLNTALERYRPRIAGFIAGMARNHSDIDDLTQETLIKMSRGWEGYKGGSSLSSWIFTIATNVVKDDYRARSVRPQTSSEVKPVIAPDSDDALTGIEKREVGDCVKGGLVGLPERYSSILVRKYIDGASIKEIANAEGASESSIKVRLYRARERFRTECAESCDLTESACGDFSCAPKQDKRASGSE